MGWWISRISFEIWACVTKEWSPHGFSWWRSESTRRSKDSLTAGEIRETHENKVGRVGNKFDLAFYPQRRRGQSEDAQTRSRKDSWHLATGRMERPCPFPSVGCRFKLCYCAVIDGGSTRRPPGERDEMGSEKSFAAHRSGAWLQSKTGRAARRKALCGFGVISFNLYVRTFGLMRWGSPLKVC